MGNLENYRQIIRRILTELANIPYSHGNLRCLPVFDQENDRYLLVTQGWNGKLAACMEPSCISTSSTARYGSSATAPMSASFANWKRQACPRIRSSLGFTSRTSGRSPIMQWHR